MTDAETIKRPVTDEEIIRRYYQERAALPQDTSDGTLVAATAAGLGLDYEQVALVMTAHWFPCA